MGTTTHLPCPSDLDPRLLEHHPELGDYVSGTNSWTQDRVVDGGPEFLLFGRGSRPSDEQVSVWQVIDERLSELVTKATATVQDPRRKPRLLELLARAIAVVLQTPRMGSTKAEFSRDALSLSQVRLERDGSFALFFHTPLEDEIDVSPMVVFRSWEVAESRWVP